MAVRHAEPANARGLVGQRLLVGAEPEIDDVTDAQGTMSESCASVGSPDVVIRSSRRDSYKSPRVIHGRMCRQV